MSAPSTSAPSPSHHIFLHELVRCKIGTKVRFLCCVLEYRVRDGVLLVEHAYPANLDSPAKGRVDVTMALEAIKRESLDSGAWLNVIGYVQDSSIAAGNKDPTARVPLVQAVMCWSAGSLSVEKYEQVMEASLKQLRESYDDHHSPFQHE